LHEQLPGVRCDPAVLDPAAESVVDQHDTTVGSGTGAELQTQRFHGCVGIDVAVRRHPGCLAEVGHPWPVLHPVGGKAVGRGYGDRSDFRRADVREHPRHCQGLRPTDADRFGDERRQGADGIRAFRDLAEHMQEFEPEQFGVQGRDASSQQWLPLRQQGGGDVPPGPVGRRFVQPMQQALHVVAEAGRQLQDLRRSARFGQVQKDVSGGHAGRHIEFGWRRLRFDRHLEKSRIPVALQSGLAGACGSGKVRSTATGSLAHVGHHSSRDPRTTESQVRRQRCDPGSDATLSAAVRRWTA
jgi:hypothetical protein